MKDITISVLFMEDEPLVRGLMRKWLAEPEVCMHSTEPVRVGVDWHECATVTAGIRMFSILRPEVILLDLWMPPDSPMENFQTVQTAAPDIPIIVITGDADSKMKVNLMEAGAAYFLRKPKMTPGMLHGAICSVVFNKPVSDLEARRKFPSLLDQMRSDTIALRAAINSG